LHWDVNDHGKFEYPNLDTYWIEPDRYPYFIKVDGHYAGFVLINKVFKILKESNGHAIAEFFILRKYRRNKIGSIAANAVFKMYPGWWEISPIMQNKASFDFWLKVAKENAVEKYYLEKSEENGLQKQVIIFNNS
jgi:predicted acetyltransferase